MSDRSKKIDEVIARLWKDEAFKQKLFADTRGTLAEAGLQFPANFKLKVHQDTAETINLVIPRNPAESELSDEALDTVAGGSSGDTACNTTCQSWCY